MSEDLTIAERYMSASTSSSLQCSERSTFAPLDIIGAAGMAGGKHGLALRLWATAQRPTRAAVHQLADRLAVRVADYLAAKHLKGKPREIAKSALMWWLDGVCRYCDGRGKEPIPGTPHLSDKLCDHCHGTGKSPLQSSNEEAARWLVAEMSALSSTAEVAIKNKIR